MLGNNSVYAQIQKRRRRSTPNSPASPSATWQNTNTAADFLYATPREESSQHAVVGPDSPALDVNVPSPTFDLPSFSLDGRQKNVRGGSFALPRFSEDAPQQSGQVLEQRRPATSSSHTPYVPHLDIPQAGKRRVFSSSPIEPSFSSPKPPSSHGPESPSLDVGAKFSDRGAFLRFDHSQSSWTSSSPVDETPPLKFAGGKKSRLNLLNPMSLLARRRSPQNQNYIDDFNIHVKTSSVPAMPDDYDPRIRGNFIHDFSAPRTRRIHSSQDSPTLQTTLPPYRPGAVEHIRRASDFSGLKDLPNKRYSQSPNHSPVFREHFQDDRQNLRPAQTGYLHSLATSEQTSDLNNANVPAFAKKLPVVIKENLELREVPPSRPPPPPPKNDEPLEYIPEAAPDTSDLLDEQTVPPTASTIPDRRPPNSASIHRRVSGVPKHMTSTSSRFSFVGNGDSAAQEKILEERHKQHASNNKTIQAGGNEGQDEEDYDDFDLDGQDDLEERIPGVNADDDFEEDIPGMDADQDLEGSRPISMPLYQAASSKQVSLKIDPDAANNYARTDSQQAFHFTPEPSALSSNSTGATSQSTPRDEHGRVIGLADTSWSPRRVSGHKRQRSDLSVMEISLGIAGLGLNVQPVHDPKLSAPLQVTASHNDAFKDEDLYFDDGEFDDLVDDVNEDHVDERIFDEGNEAVRDIPAENARKLEEAQQRDSISKAVAVGQDHSGYQWQSQASDQELAGSLPVPVAVNAIDAASNAAKAGLTEGNLAAYHAALVSAADKAAANGRFTRSVSNSYYSDTSTSQLEDSPPGLSDDKRNSHNVEFSGVDEDDGFDFDDNDEDDLIAEANAEVLENDDDGFYGQEFGFYARAKGKNTTELEYGGYFAPRGANGVKRSHSAKANFQEPSLTPITERSEWSPRNSVASLTIPGIPGSAHPISSPRITHLLEFESSSFDENMAFEALKKLRRGAFGGSSTSMDSLGGPPSSSPLAHVSAHSFTGGDAGHRMTSSIHSLAGSAGIAESEEEDNDAWEEPTFTRNTPTNDADAPGLWTHESTTTFSPLSARSDKRTSHSRNSSGAESVSYVRDTDGGWLLERRRTGDDGEGEVVGREYVAGSRI